MIAKVCAKFIQMCVGKDAVTAQQRPQEMHTGWPFTVVPDKEMSLIYWNQPAGKEAVFPRRRA